MKDQTVFDALAQKYQKAAFANKGGTKERILLTAAALFAKNGYFGVSVKDITSVVGIKPASLYNYYESKEALWKDVLNRIQDSYLVFFNRLEAVKPNSTTLADVIDNLFYEFKKDEQMFSFYGIALVQSEQFHSSMAADMFHGVFLNYSISIIKRHFDDLVTFGNVEPFDTQAVASVLMYSILILNNVRVHEDMGRKGSIKAAEQLDTLKELILSMANAKVSVN